MEKEKYALVAKVEGGRLLSDGYYTGQSYIYQGSRYAVVDTDIKKSKNIYKREKSNQGKRNGF